MSPISIKSDRSGSNLVAIGRFGTDSFKVVWSWFAEFLNSGFCRSASDLTN
jgi:hypothetical protein